MDVAGAIKAEGENGGGGVHKMKDPGAECIGDEGRPPSEIGGDFDADGITGDALDIQPENSV